MQDLYRLILGGIREYAIFTLDLSGRISTWTPGAEALLGFSEVEAVGRSFGFSATPEDIAAGRPKQILDEAAKWGSVAEERWHVRKNGTRFWGSGLLRAVKDEDGRTLFYVKIVRDSTDRKQAEEAREAAKREAEAANEAKDHFLANISHELRTPLTAILLWAMLLEEDKNLDPRKLREGLKNIRRSAEEQRELIEDLVDTARIAAGKLRLELREAPLIGTVEAGIQSVRPAAEEKGVSIAQDLDPASGAVLADHHRLKQVVWNLVNNAVKFTPTGGTVKVLMRRHEGDVEIRVTDTGEGIGPELLPRIFERFQQGVDHQPGLSAGLGLGLSIVKQLVEAHGGHIGVQSDGPGLGAVFTVLLPLPATDIVGGSGVKLREPSKFNHDTTLDGFRILLVEDEAGTREALSMILRQRGADVAGAGSAAEAFEEFRCRRPDIIVSDIALPNADGYELIRKIREFEAEGRGAAVPALALAAFSGDKRRRKAIQSGFQKFLTKPVEPDRLASVITGLLRPRA